MSNKENPQLPHSLTPKEVNKILTMSAKSIGRMLARQKDSPGDQIDNDWDLMSWVDETSKRGSVKEFRLRYPEDSAYEGKSILIGCIIAVQHDNRQHLVVFKTGEMLLMRPKDLQMAQMIEVLDKDGDDETPPGQQEGEVTIFPYRGEDHEEDAGDVYRSVFSTHNSLPYELNMNEPSETIWEDIYKAANLIKMGIPFIGVSHTNTNEDDLPVIKQVLERATQTADETAEMMEQARDESIRFLLSTDKKKDNPDTPPNDPPSDEPPPNS